MAEENKIKIHITKDDKTESSSTPIEPQSTEVSPSAKGKEDKKEVAPPTGPKILLVDDDELILQMYQSKLEKSGYQVKTAMNGTDALIVAKENQPKIIFLDVVMADVNGAEILKNLKARPETKAIPVIMLTNFSDKEEDIEGSKKMGALDYLIKAQTDPEALVKRIKKFLDTGK